VVDIDENGSVIVRPGERRELLTPGVES
jgi:hypothetical protein